MRLAMKWLKWRLGKKRWVCPICGKVERVTWLKGSGTLLVHVCVTHP